MKYRYWEFKIATKYYIDTGNLKLLQNTIILYIFIKVKFKIDISSVVMLVATLTPTVTA